MSTGISWCKSMVILILFLAGVLSAQLFGSEFLATYGFLNEYHLQSFAAAKIQKVDLELLVAMQPMIHR